MEYLKQNQANRQTRKTLGSRQSRESKHSVVSKISKNHPPMMLSFCFSDKDIQEINNSITQIRMETQMEAQSSSFMADPAKPGVSRSKVSNQM